MRSSLLTLLLLLLLPMGGCGYQWVDASEPTGTLWRGDVKTVAVPIFTNPTFRREDGLKITRAIAQEIEARTPYRVAAEDVADTVLEGRIVSANTATVIRNRDNAQPQEQLYVMRIDFVWKDLRTGRVLVERRNFEAAQSFFPYFGESDFVGSQSTAESLATAVVDQLQNDW
jgi:hypothetical protein